MADVAERNLSVEDVIERAFTYFEQYVARDKTNFNHVLLEAFEADGDDWIVTIGFDEGRFKERSSTLNFGESITEPIREIRHIHVSGKDGSLKRIS
ncbi:hypothetical protein [Rhodobacteraceae bacterium W635]|uniref:hypothetical protein n=1 Tax=Nioella halotolerans TaxID=2303578 RepID=UPI0011C15B9B